MRNLTKENFIKFMVKHEACQPGLDWALSQDTARDIVEKCPEGQYLDWLIQAIGGEMDAEYNNKIDPMWAEYDEKNALLWDEYNEKCYTIAREICTFERVQEEIGVLY